MHSCTRGEWPGLGTDASIQLARQLVAQCINADHHPFQALDFGCILSDTLRRLPVTLINPGKARVEYSWAWLHSGDAPAAAEPPPESEPPIAAVRSLLGPGGARPALASSARYAPSVAATSARAPTSPLFDLVPIRGVLGPGESETLEVSFYGFPGCKVAATAVCHVTDGPDYQARQWDAAVGTPLTACMGGWRMRLSLQAGGACPVYGSGNQRCLSVANPRTLQLTPWLLEPARAPLLAARTDG